MTWQHTHMSVCLHTNAVHAFLSVQTLFVELTNGECWMKSGWETEANAQMECHYRHTLLCPLPEVNFINISQSPSLQLEGRAVFNLTSVGRKSICLLLGNAAQSNCGLLEHAACLWTTRRLHGVCVRGF